MKAWGGERRNESSDPGKGQSAGPGPLRRQSREGLDSVQPVSGLARRPSFGGLYSAGTDYPSQGRRGGPEVEYPQKRCTGNKPIDLIAAVFAGYAPFAKVLAIILQHVIAVLAEAGTRAAHHLISI